RHHLPVRRVDAGGARHRAAAGGGGGRRGREAFERPVRAARPRDPRHRIGRPPPRPRISDAARVKAQDRVVERLRALLPPSGSVLWGPGDDAALIDRSAGLLAATTDLLVEEVDFLAGEDPERLGRRAARVNLSDLAAVGAAPEAFLLGIAFP